METVRINETVCLKHELTLQDVLTCIAITDKDYTTSIRNLIARGVIKRGNGRYVLEKEWKDIIDKVLEESQEVKITDERLTELAKKMRELYPQGRMLDRLTGRPTPYYFRCNVSEVSKKLKTFFTRYGDYSDEDVLDATKRYVASYEGNYQQKGFRLIKYFILKDDVKQGPDGNYVEPLSPLLDFLENKEDDDVVPMNDDWLVTTRN